MSTTEKQAGTTVATTGNAAPAKTNGNEIERIQRDGMQTLAERKVLAEMYRMVQATEWGAALSEKTATNMARFCIIAGIEIPSEELDILGGKPYRNAKHWTKRMLKDPNYIDFDSVSIMNDAEKREQWGVPEWALAAYEVSIRSLVDFAPIEKIRSGEITDISQYIRITREANWAPSKKGNNAQGKPLDPIGTSDPHKTARTRTLRRGAEKAFPATIAKHEEKFVKPALEALLAEWEEIKSDRAQARAQLPAAGEQQAVVTGNGEPHAGRDISAVTQSTAAAEQPLTDDERHELRRTLMGNLRASGIDETKRKQWQADNKLPESTKEWTRENFAAANTTLTEPARIKYFRACAALHLDPEAYAQKHIQKVASTVKEYNELTAMLNGQADWGEREPGQDDS